ncbi:MAG: MFS transporter [Desulfotomaculales bacterium]
MLAPEKGRKQSAYRFIILLGIVSLFADMTYEGARSITGPYLSLLGASATVVGVVSGLGELVGYSIRLVSGYFADRTRRYWLLTSFGYVFNLLAVPLLALAGHWETAAFLIILERLGKAIRTPPRDAMLSHAAQVVGRGWGFALHEAMDQVGALTGPLLISLVLYLQGGYRQGFALLLAPALLALTVLVLAHKQYPDPAALELPAPGGKEVGRELRFLPVFWLYIAFTVLSIAGYAHFQLISYHLKAQAVVPDVQIPVFFALAMGVDALFALLIGRVFDRLGLLSLVAVPLLTLPVPFLVFGRGFFPVLAGVVLWGAVMGIQETIMRAAIAEMVPSERRGFAYGIFNTAYGGSWFLGSVVMGALYDISIPSTILFSVILEVLSIPLLILATRKSFPAAGS